MITDQIRTDMLAAVKSRDNPKRDILKLVLGEIDLQVARTGVQLSDDRVFQIIRKILDGLQITLDEMNKRAKTIKDFDFFKITAIENEYAILSPYLPKMLTLDEIVQALPDEIKVQIKSSTPEDYGKMTGTVMKYLKGKGLSVEGNSVKLAILNIKN